MKIAKTCALALATLGMTFTSMAAGSVSGPAAEAATLSECGPITMFTVHHHDDEGKANLNRYDNAKPTQEQPTDSHHFGYDSAWAKMKLLAVDDNRVLAVKGGDGADAGVLYAYTYKPGDVTSISDAVKVGHGFGEYRQLFAAGNGVLLGVAENGDLMHFKWKGTGYGDGHKIGNGWGSFKAVTADANGTIYAIAADGTLKWYHHSNIASGEGTFKGPETVGSGGWAVYDQLASAGDGVLYAHRADGTMVRYNYTGSDDATGTWTSTTFPNTYFAHRLMAVKPTSCGQHKPDSSDPVSYPLRDNYPYKGETKGVDRWNFFKGQCTSFAAWAVNDRLGIKFQNDYKGAHFGDAQNWDNAARKAGLKVSTTPHAGDVAVRDSGEWGHVAFVAKVNKDGSYVIEEYNHVKKYTYSTRTVTKNTSESGQFDSFITFK